MYRKRTLAVDAQHLIALLMLALCTTPAFAQDTPVEHAQSDKYWAEQAQSYPAFVVDESQLRTAAADITISLGNLNGGVAATDSRGGTGYIMYSQENVFTRFSANPPNRDNANHLIAVVYDGGTWKYDDNTTLRTFSPLISDRLVAEVNFSNDTATLLTGQATSVNGINAGYISGNLVITPNVWPPNPGAAGGEFGLQGTFITASSELTIMGQWGPVLDWPHIPVSAAHLPDGRILTWASNKTDAFPSGPEFTYAAAWNPANDDFKLVPHTSHDMFCAHQVMLDDGQLLVMGGRNTVDRVSSYDYKTDTWTREAPMADRRWYPTAVALPNNEVMVAIGSGGSNNPELWNEDTGWRKLTGVNLSGPILNYTGHYERNWWPLFHVAPNGNVFHSGPTPDMHYINTTGNGSITRVGPKITDWYPKHGTTVMYEEGKILTAGGAISGGNLASSNRAMVIDINGGAPVVRNVARMAHARKFQNGVPLPTGEVLVIGGNTSGTKFSDNGSVLTAELFDPVTETWTELADMSVPRNYHSVALLMTDGRVWAGGGGLCGGCAANHQDAQVFSPPYLFNADGTLAVRPVINSAPDIVRNGQSISVSATAGLTRFSAVKMSSTTHGVDSDVRQISLSFTELGGGNYDVAIHSNKNVMTPGYWMLFGVNADGVPSEAAVMQITNEGVPVISGINNQFTPEGEATSLQVNATSSIGASLTYSATGLPSGLSINGGSGLISGTPANGSAGSYTVTVAASDGVLSADTQFLWIVTNGATGQILREWWTGIGGNEINLLTSNSDYPDNPDGSDYRDRFEAPTNWADNYGTRMRGYIYPPVTGDYTFWIASDDNGELWLSSDNNPSNAQRISNVPGWASSREWSKFPQQQSAPISLVEGQRYYIEAFQKEGGGGDNLAVAWQVPGGSLEVIEGGFLSPYLGEPAINDPGNRVIAAGASVSFQIEVTAPGNASLSYSASDLPQGLSINSSTGLISGSTSSPGTYESTVTVSNGQTSDTATFSWIVVTGQRQNMALNKPVSQSSLSSDPAAVGGVPERAVDGNTNGLYGNNSVTHTKIESQAWWEVDMGEVYLLESVDIWNRTDCCSSRLSNFHVLVSDVPFTSQNLDATINQDGVSDIHFTGTVGTTTNLNIGRTGRYLRVQLNGTNILSLAEVVVNGYPLVTNAPPVIDSIADQQGTEGEAVSLQVNATDPDGDIVTLSANGLPDGVFMSSTGFISGGYVAGTAGATMVTIEANDGTETSSMTFMMNIDPARGSWIDFTDDSNTLSIADDSEEKDIAVGDLNKDGYDDIVVVRKEGFMGLGARTDLLIMNEAGTLVDRTADYAPGFTTDPTIARDAIIADLDGDGWEDVLIANTFEDQPKFYRNLGNDPSGWLGLADESTSRLPTIDVGSVQFCGVSAGDVNGDGAPDLYFANYIMDGTTKDVLLINDGNGVFTDEGADRLGDLINVAFGTQGTIADMDGDGDNDIVKLSANQPADPFPTDGIFILYNDGTGNFTNFSTVPSEEAYMFIMEDFDNNGETDFYIVDDGADYVNLSNGITPNSNINFTQQETRWARTALNGANLRAADLDRDGDIDLGVADVDTSFPPCETPDDLRSFLLLENEGDATGTFIDPFGAADKPWSQNLYDFAFVDINNDGNLDIFSAGCTGYGLFTSTQDPVEPPPPDEFVVDGDFEIGPVIPQSPGWQTYSAGQTIHGVWEVTSGTVDIHHYTIDGAGLGLQPSGGLQHLDLQGDNPGRVIQTINSLTPGQTYKLSFYYAAYPFSPIVGTARARVTIGNLDHTWTATTSGAQSWVQYSGTFIAGDTSEELAFEGLGSARSWGGVLIDLVDITACDNSNCTVAAPQVASFSPVSGSPGDPVTITGSNFTGAVTVSFGGVEASIFSVVSDTEITANVPSGAATGKITVATGSASGTSSADFTVDGATGGNLIVAGDFEGDPLAADGGWITYFEGENLYGVWEVIGGSIDIHHYRHANAGVPIYPASGLHHIDLQGAAPGMMKQAISGMTVGQKYKLSFQYAIYPYFAITEASANVQLGLDGNMLNETWTATNPGNTSWQAGSFVFEATATSGELQLSGFGSARNWGGMLMDDVVLEACETCVVGAAAGMQLTEAPELMSGPELPEEFGIRDAFPNPFNTATDIVYGMPEGGYARMEIYNATGQLIRVLIDGEQPQGYRRIRWEGDDSSGAPVASGVYLLRFEGGGTMMTRKVVVVR